MIGSILLLASCLCGVVPERQDDFFWENDLFGMRAYGPSDAHAWSGLDIFNKMSNETSVGYLLKNHDTCGNWHVTPWKGILDNYAVGAGRGVGGVAVFGDGEWKTYANWEKARVIQANEACCEFELTYPAFSALGKMTYHITLRKGDRFFKNTVTFEKDLPKDYRVGPGLDVNPARGHDGALFSDPSFGGVVLFEKDRGPVEGATATAVFLDPADVAGCRVETDSLGCRILTLKKKSFTYWAGAAWSRAGQITDFDQWLTVVRKFRAQLEEERK